MTGAYLLSSSSGVVSSIAIEKNNVDSFLEMYLGEDILQGEKVPFYLLWKGIPVENLRITYRGFKSLIRLYNVKRYEKIDFGAVINRDSFKTAGYIGGVLSTTLSESPSQHAELILVIARAKRAMPLSARVVLWPMAPAPFSGD